MRPPAPNTDKFVLEKCKPGQLLELFALCLKTGPRGTEYSLLPEAWGTLFSHLFLSPVDLIEEMQNGSTLLAGEDQNMLRRFIKADCANRGTFVLNVINKGGMIDRAALIIIADPGDLAGYEHDGTTALHMLFSACDKRVRPTLITKAGGRLLSSVFDKNGIPVLFSLFSMSDICAYDLDAIQQVFSPAELKTVMAKNRMGRNAYEIFIEISRSVRSKPSRDRNAFAINHAVKTTNPERAVRQQINSPAGGMGVALPQMKAVAPKPAAPVTGSTPALPEVPALEKHSSPEPTGAAMASIAEPDPGATTIAPDRGETRTAGSRSVTARTMKIMLVEDDPVILKLLQLRLLAMGYPVCAMAESGEDAVKLAGDTHPDLVFMDIGLPGKMDGIDAAREIKAQSGSRIVFLTGHCDPELVDRAKNILPEGYILKPFTDTDLRVTLTLLK